MPLNEFQITNFKAFSNPDPIPIRPITLIFGPNSSGKSSIIQALLLLKQTLQDENPNAVLSPKGNEVDLGSFYEFVHRHEVEREVSFKMSVDLNNDDENLEPWLRPLLKDFSSLAFKPTFSYDNEEKQIKCSSLELFIGDDLEPVVTFKPTANNSEVFDVDSINSDHHFWKTLWDEVIRKFRDYVLLEVTLKKVELEKQCNSLRNAIGKQPNTNQKKDKSPDKKKKNIRDFIGTFEPEKELEKVSKLLELLNEVLERLGNYTYESLIKDFRKLKADYTIVIKKFLLSSKLNDLTDFVPWDGISDIINWSDLQSIVEELRNRFRDWDFGLANEQDEDGWFIKLSDLGHIVYSFLPSEIALYTSKVLQKELSKIVYISGLRQQPERYYIHRGNKVEQVGKSGAMAADLLLQDKDVLKRTNEFFNRLKYELKVSPLSSPDGEVQDVYAIRLDNMEMNIHANISDVGFGISQVLPVVVQSAVSQNTTLCIEQPELHLHPGAQKELGDLFIESALGERKNTFIIETHSEHIILRILRRIRETSAGNIENRTPIKPEDVSVIYAEPSPNGTKLHQIRVTKNGDFADRWPTGFFTERIGELF